MAFNKKGFTLVELMISITIFALAAILVLSGVLYIGKLYQQAQNRTALEDIARQVQKDVLDSVRFAFAVSSTPVTAGGYDAQCIGNKMYIYGNNADLGARNAGLYFIDTDGGCQDTLDTFNPNDEQNLLPPNAKVGVFRLEENPADSGIYEVTINLFNSGDDLIEQDPTTNIVTCKSGGINARQWCAAVTLKGLSIKRNTT